MVGEARRDAVLKEAQSKSTTGGLHSMLESKYMICMARVLFSISV